MKTPRPPWLLVLAVLALHLLLGHEVQRIQEGWVHDGPPPAPPRMQVDFVKEMVLQAPATVRVLPPPPPKPVTPPPAAEAMPSTAALPASVPEPSPEPSPVVAEAASAAEAPAAAASPVAQAASVAASDEPGPEWPLSTRLTYVLTGNYRGPVHGEAQVEWLRKGRDYQVHLDVAVGPSFAPFITRRMTSQGQLTEDGIAPQRYDEETKLIIGDARRASVFFLPTEVQLASGVRQPVPRGAQDSASQFVQLTWLFLTGRELLGVGRVVSFPLVLPGRQYEQWSYEVVGEEWVETGTGWVPSWHLKPTRPVKADDMSAEIWLAPGLQYLPVRLLIRQDAQTFIDLKLKSAPMQAAPESTNDIPRRLSP